MTAKEKAMKNFRDGYNCSQSVVLAFSDKLGIDDKTLLKLSSSFGGGMGRLREVCGAVTGMFIVVGFLYGYNDPNDKQAKANHYELIQQLAKEFKDANHSIICRDLLGLGEGPDNPIPSERTKQYYAERPCEELVGHAAEIVEKYIANKNKN
ncbi:MAG TPA: C-GCAxxG-C-C family protein [Clostridia bacterium]|nr:C-GCAxxG-C-C family protein [Clostridia bacterium]